MQAITLNKLKQLKEQFFKLKPDSKQVYILNHYDRGSKTYSVSLADDISSERFLKASKLVYIGFTY